MRNRSSVASKPRARLRWLRTTVGIACTVTGLALLAGTGPGARAYTVQPDGNYDGVTTLSPNASDTCGDNSRWVKFATSGITGNDKTASAVASQPYDMQYDELEAPDGGPNLINIDSVTSTAAPTGARAFWWVFIHTGLNSRNYWNFNPPVYTTPVALDPAGDKNDNTNQLILCVSGPLTTVRVVKVDGNQQPLSGAVFTVYLNGVPYTYVDPLGVTHTITGTTGADGVATVMVSAPNDYTLVETTPPTGYPLPDPAPSLPFTVTDVARTIEVGTVVNTTTATTTTTVATTTTTTTVAPTTTTTTTEPLATTTTTTVAPTTTTTTTVTPTSAAPTIPPPVVTVTTPTIPPPLVVVTTTLPPATEVPTAVPTTVPTSAAVATPFETTTSMVTASPAVLGATETALPYTGAETENLTLLALALILGGLLLALVPARKARTS